MRELGVRGVGQSSWGPTLFAFAADENSAADLIDRLAALEEFADAQIACTPPNNGGARIEANPHRAVAGYSKP